MPLLLAERREHELLLLADSTALAERRQEPLRAKQPQCHVSPPRLRPFVLYLNSPSKRARRTTGEVSRPPHRISRPPSFLDFHSTAHSPPSLRHAHPSRRPHCRRGRPPDGVARAPPPSAALHRAPVPVLTRRSRPPLLVRRRPMLRRPGAQGTASSPPSSSVALRSVLAVCRCACGFGGGMEGCRSSGLRYRVFLLSRSRIAALVLRATNASPRRPRALFRHGFLVYVGSRGAIRKICTCS
jgi:hypothetical protein